MRPRRCRSAHAQAACIAVMCAWSGLAAFGDRQGAAAALHDAAAAVLPVFEAGAARAKQLDVVIAGCARDIAPHLAMVRGRLAMLKAQFRSATMMVFENGSSDGTRAELERWRGTGLIDDLLGWDLSQESRTTALAHARRYSTSEPAESTRRRAKTTGTTWSTMLSSSNARSAPSSSSERGMSLEMFATIAPALGTSIFLPC